MNLVKKFCVVINAPIYTSEGTDNRLRVIREFESMDQILAYYREADEQPNENHPLWPEGARVIEIYVSSKEPFINI